MKIPALFAIIALLLPTAAAADDAPSTALAGVDSFILETMEEWKVPGLAIAVVHDGKVIVSKGYGSRDVKRNLPVTPRTLFAIGSITKSFTVTALATLADEGKLDWDKPVREYLPGFRLYDAAASDRITPRDLVTHRSGLPTHNLLWYYPPFSREEMLGRLRFLAPSKDFRSAFQYNNLMFMTAGALAGEVAGSSWEALVQERILSPLGMRTSNFSVSESQKSSDFAAPYKVVEDEILLSPFKVIDAIGPAGSINSNVEEMATYLQFHIDQGAYQGRQIVSKEQARQMHTPHIVRPDEIEDEELWYRTYGMGWDVWAYRGHTRVEHKGAIDGFRAHLTFMPKEKIGMVILTNSSRRITEIVAYNLYDRLLGLEQVRWRERFRERDKKLRANAEERERKEKRTRKEGTRPSHKLDEYAGTYEHPGYGNLSIAHRDEGLSLTFYSWSSPLRHFHYDVFEVLRNTEHPLLTLEGSKVRFETNAKGEVQSVSVPLESAVADIVFERKQP